MNPKLIDLKAFMAQYRSAVIAFSGGVDSTFLARVAHDVFGEKLLLVTIDSAACLPAEGAQAARLASELGIQHLKVAADVLAISEFRNNSAERCYFCKRELLAIILKIAQERGFQAVFDGTNADDTRDYRPGLRALAELNVLSPLKEAGLSKQEIRSLSRAYRLRTHNHPALACLATRFPYGESITAEKLAQVGKAETQIRALGFQQVRLRVHGTIARLEVGEQQLNKALRSRKKIATICGQAGFLYTALDLTGYDAGSMNRTI